MKLITLKERPYQILFLLGGCMAFLGTIFWFQFLDNQLKFFPAPNHAATMIGAFLFSFISGFLFTAGPKFTNSHLPSKGQVLFQFAIIALAASLSFLGLIKWAFVCQLFAFINLIIFLLMRFIKRRNNPPLNFLFVPVGLLMGIISTLIHLYFYFIDADYFLLNFAQTLFYRGFIYALFLGIGARLFPVLLGHSEMDQINLPIKIANISKSPMLLFTVLFFITSIIFSMLSNRWSNFLLATVTIFIAIKDWKILSLPKRKSCHAYAIYLALWFLILGPLLAFIWPVYEIDFLHLTYIGGYGLLTLVVAMRVIFSHGGHNLEKNENSYIIFGIALLTISASFFRAYSPFADNFWTSIQISGLVWISMLIIWFFFLSKKIIFIEN